MEWGFQHNTSTPTYPQSNGKAEAAVKSMKKFIQAAWTGSQVDEGRLARSLLQYCNTPSRRDNLSPAQKLFGRPIPAHHRAFAQEWQRDADKADKQAYRVSEYVEQHYNRHAFSLPDINIGSNVAIQNPIKKRWDIYGVITEIGPYRRYSVKTASGRVLVRNRRFLRCHVPMSPPKYTGPGHPALVRPNPPADLPQRSTRPHTCPKCLIEEISFK